MASPIVIRTEAELKKLKFGVSYIVAPDGLPDDPEELLASDAYVEAEKLRAKAETLFL